MQASHFAAQELVLDLRVSLFYQEHCKSLVSVDGNGVGIRGYDPVTYSTEGRAAKGDPQYSSNYGGATYYFKSSDDKAAFDKDPAKYAPQFGGYCAMAMAMGKQEDADPNFFLVHDGKLLLQRNEKAHMMFMKDPAENHKKADEQWKKLQRRRVQLSRDSAFSFPFQGKGG